MIKKILHHFKGNSFCLLLNIINKIYGKKDRYKYQDKKYIILNNKYNVVFPYRKQGLYAYFDGLEERIKSIENEYMLHHIKFHSGDYIIDVGANIGDLFLYFKSKKSNIKYIAYEPSLPEYECLRLNTKGKLNNIGLWTKKDFKTFYFAPKNADSSFIKPKGYDKTVKVKVNRLDNLIKNIPIKLIKIDAEGAEPEVLYSAAKILKSTMFISVDMGFERGENEDSTISEVCNFLIKNNFILLDFNAKRITGLFKNTKVNF